VFISDSQPAITKGRIFKDKFSIILKDSYTQSVGAPLFILVPICFTKVPQFKDTKGKYMEDNRSLNVSREERLHIPLTKDRGSQDALYSF